MIDISDMLARLEAKPYAPDAIGEAAEALLGLQSLEQSLAMAQGLLPSRCVQVRMLGAALAVSLCGKLREAQALVDGPCRSDPDARMGEMVDVMWRRRALSAGPSQAWASVIKAWLREERRGAFGPRRDRNPKVNGPDPAGGQGKRVYSQRARPTGGPGKDGKGGAPGKGGR